MRGSAVHHSETRGNDIDEEVNRAGAPRRARACDGDARGPRTRRARTGRNVGETGGNINCASELIWADVSYAVPSGGGRSRASPLRRFRAMPVSRWISWSCTRRRDQLHGGRQDRPGHAGGNGGRRFSGRPHSRPGGRHPRPLGARGDLQLRSVPRHRRRPYQLGAFSARSGLRRCALTACWPVVGRPFEPVGEPDHGADRKAECKNGGWRLFGDTFKNQGECVRLFGT